MMHRSKKTEKVRIRSSRLWLNGAAICVVLVFGVIGVKILGSGSAASTTTDTYLTIRLSGYSGSVAFTTETHSIGDCNSAPGQIFYVGSNGRTCSGSTIGYPDGMILYVASVPSGYSISSTSIYGAGNHNCYSNHRCYLNMSSGSAYLDVTFVNNNAPPPGPSCNSSNFIRPNLSARTISRSEIDYSWTAGSLYCVSSGGYSFVAPGHSATLNANARQFKLTGLSCNTTLSNATVTLYGYPESNYRTTSNAVTAKTSSCPAPPAPPSSGGSGGSSTTRPPTRSPSPTLPSTHKSSGSSSSSSASGSKSSIKQLVKMPPATPKSFTARADEGSGVYLSWIADTAVGSYKLERSGDNKSWTTLNDAITDDYYFDTATTFATTFYYRLTAKGLNNLSSKPATSQVTTNDFAYNVGKDTDLKLTSDDGVFTVQIPAKALKQPANCQIASDSTLPLVTIKDFKQAYGPYQIVCQQGDDAFVKQFEEPLSAELNFQKSHLKENYASYTLAGYGAAANSWRQFAVPDGQTAPIIKIQLNSEFTGLNVFGKPKHTSPFVILLRIFFTLLLLVVAAVLILRFYYRYNVVKQAQGKEQDYWRKERGL